ncbi:phospholipase/carboxylesterase [Cruoricaptor ignavus]|uniref:Phospholipase/carboxylesterase n=1 Tax=Cruoricaptor ignavus TaxID=1118202 RepID=A0A1M6G036_9FLAO|nr:phospholipase [Cruoricaptor ignavus]SHJ03355.1 phospholipase/carboxylesterase [Cruoricaptor ignavus]
MDLKYLVREPENITEHTPIIFLLHGYGSNEQDLFSFTPELPKDWIVVSFRAPRNTPYEGFCWYDIDFSSAERFIDVEQAEESLSAILEKITEIKKFYGIENAPTHIAGFSQGGILSYTLSLKNPEFFAKVILLSCYPEMRILQNIEKDKKKFQHLRFFVSHGTEDAVIPLEWARKGADLLYDLGCFFTFREYMAGHGINQKNFIDLMQFLND